MHKKSASIVLTLLFACGIANAAEESLIQLEEKAQSSVHQKDIAEEEGFYKALSALEASNPGTFVETNFKKFLEKPDLYLSFLTKKYLFNVMHAPMWSEEIGAASESAKKNDWKSCQLAATRGLAEKADVPVLLFLRAIAEKKLNENKLCLSDLERLYAIKSKKDLNKNINSSDNPEEKEFFDFLLL